MDTCSKQGEIIARIYQRCIKQRACCRHRQTARRIGEAVNGDIFTRGELHISARLKRAGRIQQQALRIERAAAVTGGERTAVRKCSPRAEGDGITLDNAAVGDGILRGDRQRFTCGQRSGVNERINQLQRGVAQGNHLTTTAEIANIEQQTAPAIEFTAPGIRERVTRYRQRGSAKHRSAVGDVPVLHSQIRTLKRATVINRTATQFSAARRQDISAIHGLHHIQQQRDGLNQPAATVCQLRRGQRELPARKNFAVVL